ncbi:DYRK4 [Cordylochernes scorpioides]|uniref:DYRK4 n=1 Tax=Cordylochernes scorpioides TaxID=51811 RepID=A0ABY6L7S2_9ARAC|nr:DYRK4 [Cordylochernes scorpioides]
MSPLGRNIQTKELCADAFKYYGPRLNCYEIGELHLFPEIWYVAPDINKIAGEPGGPQNGGYDDDNGSYIKVPGCTSDSRTLSSQYSLNLPTNQGPLRLTRGTAQRGATTVCTRWFSMTRSARTLPMVSGRVSLKRLELNKSPNGVSTKSSTDTASTPCDQVLHDHIAYRYEILEIIGKGSFGQVIRVHDHKTDQQVALKIIRNKKRFQQQALMEVKILEYLAKKDKDGGHNIIQILDHFYFRNHLCITFELMGMNLYELIKKNNYRGFSLSLIRRFALSLVQCLKLLYKEKIIHCDLKPENILLKYRGSSSIKVIDFGSSCFANHRIYTYIQSRFYRSPELALDTKGLLTQIALDTKGLLTQIALDTKGLLPLIALDTKGLLTQIALDTKGLLPLIALDTKGLLTQIALDTKGLLTQIALDTKELLPLIALDTKGLLTQIALDTKGLLTQIALDTKGLLTQIALDTKGLLPQITLDTKGLLTQIALDTKGLLAQIALDTKGLLTQIALDTKELLTQIALDTKGLLTQIALDTKGLLTQTALTTRVMLTQVILGQPYGPPIDMWSLGCILAELYTGYPLFPGENEADQLACFMEIFGPPPPSVLEASARRRLFFDSKGNPRPASGTKGKKRKLSGKTLATALGCSDEDFVHFVARCLE